MAAFGTAPSMSQLALRAESILRSGCEETTPSFLLVMRDRHSIGQGDGKHHRRAVRPLVLEAKLIGVLVTGLASERHDWVGAGVLPDKRAV
jgi:hypothetical protein